MDTSIPVQCPPELGTSTCQQVDKSNKHIGKLYALLAEIQDTLERERQDHATRLAKVRNDMAQMSGEGLRASRERESELQTQLDDVTRLYRQCQDVRPNPKPTPRENISAKLVAAKGDSGLLARQKSAARRADAYFKRNDPSLPSPLTLDEWVLALRMVLPKKEIDVSSPEKHRNAFYSVWRHV